MASRSVLRILAGSAAASLVGALELQVFIHYPEKGSAVEKCGFSFLVGTNLQEYSSPVPAQHVGPDLFRAKMELTDHHLFTQLLLGVFADRPNGEVAGSSPECNAVCPKLAPARLGQLGPYHRTQPLAPETQVHIWPHFCQYEWATKNMTQWSPGLERQMTYSIRLPAMYIENPLPRTTEALPPVMFRFNGEWFWGDRNGEDFNTWHDLMLMGEMHPFVSVEISVLGFDWKAWSDQPIFGLEPPKACGACKPELSFICESWTTSGMNMYLGGNHSYGKAAAYFDDLYEKVLPKVLVWLPPRLDADQEALKVGVWGYCIGGLAAWNAMTVKPGRFNIGYLGSPAMDYNCGNPFDQLENFSWTKPPKIYIDAGASEDFLMQRQTLLLFNKLEEKGLVEGRDLFYVRVEFGTHEGKMLWKRSIKGLLTLFGADSSIRYQPVGKQESITGGDGDTALAKLDGMSSTGLDLPEVSWSHVFVLSALVLSFFAGRKSGLASRGTTSASEPLLHGDSYYREAA